MHVRGSSILVAAGAFLGQQESIYSRRVQSDSDSGQTRAVVDRISRLPGFLIELQPRPRSLSVPHLLLQ